MNDLLCLPIRENAGLGEKTWLKKERIRLRCVGTFVSRFFLEQGDEANRVRLRGGVLRNLGW